VTRGGVLTLTEHAAEYAKTPAVLLTDVEA
jgi:hypothetical protein